ncbi:MAG TPA: translocation/assembly module TamB domain-containing protein, partial [Haliangiales bacterium]|nr:translocation/assembly module TamB domain-containing protein [Haliangiales bacterium]
RTLDVAASAGRPDTPFAGSARAHVERRPDGAVALVVPELTLRTRQLEWRGRAARVTVAPDGGVAIEGASLRSRAGAIEVAGRLAPAGGRLQVDLAGVQIDQVRRAVLPEGPTLRGTLDGRVTALRSGARLRDIRAKVRAVGLAWRPDGEAVSVDLDGALVDRNLTASLAVDGGRSGKAKIDIDARGPADPLDPRAWRRVDARDVRRLRVELAGVSLARLAEVLPAAVVGDEPPTGTIAATLDAGPGLASVAGTVSVADLTTPFVDRPLRADLKVDLAGGRLAVTGRAERQGGGAADIDVRVAVPPRPADWPDLDLGALRDSRVALAAVPLAAVPGLARLLPGLEGAVSGEVRVDGADAVTARLTVDKARAGGLSSPVDAELDASLGADRLHARLTTKLAGARFVDAELTLGAGMRALRRGDAAAFRAAPVDARAQIEGVPLALVREAAAVIAPLDGTLTARVELSGSLATPAGRLDATLADARVGAVAFERVEASARADRRTLSGKVAAVEGTGGTLEATVELSPGDARSGRARVKAERFDLGFLAALEPSGLGIRKGVLDADLELDGGLARPAARGSARISGGELRVAEVLEQLHAAEVTVALEPGRVTAALRSGVGSRGKLELDARAAITGLALGASEGTFRADALRVDAGGTRAEVSAAGKLAGEPGGGAYALAITLDSARIDLPKQGSGDELHPTGLPTDVVLVDGKDKDAARPARAAPFLTIRLRTPGAIALRGESLRADLTADLDLTVGGDPTMRGRVTIDDGYFDLFGRHWDFAASQIVFGGETPIDPRLSLHLAYEFPATTVRIAVTGTLKRPSLDLSSDSDAYDKAQLLGFVLGGSPDDTRPSPDASLARDALGTASGLVFGQLQPLVNRVVPVDVISVKQESLPALAEPTTLVTLGKWFTSDVYVAYRHRFLTETETGHNTNEGLLQYFFWRRWRFDVLFGDAGNGSADLLWVKRW